MSERITVHLDDWSKGLGTLWGPSDLTLERLEGRTIVANGCFDILHPGHLSLLAQLDTLAFKLRLRPLIALNSDESVKLLKGPSRPIVPQQARAALLNNLKWPFTVVIFDEATPQRLMDTLKPLAVFKGAEYKNTSVIKWKDSFVEFAEMTSNWSTTKILGDTR